MNPRYCTDFGVVCLLFLADHRLWPDSCSHHLRNARWIVDRTPARHIVTTQSPCKFKSPVTWHLGSGFCNNILERMPDCDSNRNVSGPRMHPRGTFVFLTNHKHRVSNTQELSLGTTGGIHSRMFAQLNQLRQLSQLGSTQWTWPKPLSFPMRLWGSIRTELQQSPQYPEISQYQGALFKDI